MILCDNTPYGEVVDENGCTKFQIDLDTDLDGVLRYNDQMFGYQTRS